MGSNLRERESLTLQNLDKLDLRRVVVLRNRVRTHIRRGPLTVEFVRHVPFVGLVTAVIAQEDDVFEAVQSEAPGRVLENLFKRCFWDAYRSGENACGQMAGLSCLQGRTRSREHNHVT
jgi:hypothetical protein